MNLKEYQELCKKTAKKFETPEKEILTWGLGLTGEAGDIAGCIKKTYAHDNDQKAGIRESLTLQPKERVDGTKSKLTITNYLGGNYFFTADEAEIDNDNILLIEAKNTKKDKLPSFEDIKDGLLKMVLFVNLEDVEVNNKNYTPLSILKLTSKSKLDVKSLEDKYTKILEPLKKEAKANNFKIKINNEFIN